MKITNYALLFLIICTALYFILFANATTLHGAEHERLKYNNAIDGAVQDGLSNLVEYDFADVVQVNRDIAINKMFQSLYSNFGCLDNNIAKSQLDMYIPLVLVNEKDGFYIYHTYEASKSSGKYFKKDWTERLPYARTYRGYLIHFQIGDDITIYEKSTGKRTVGNYHDLAHKFPAIDFLRNEDTFQTVRKSTIIHDMSKAMEYYINNHNKLAHAAGITYQFYVPMVKTEDWNRTIDNVSMMVVFQGYPFKNTTGYYNRMEIAAARIHKRDVYFITSRSGKKYYHEYGCSFVTDHSHPYQTQKECASLGAFPCPVCEP